jgi:hypothetical protein
MKSTANLVDEPAGWPAHVMKLLVDGFTTKIARAARSFVCWAACGTPWCRLSASRQALLVPAHLRLGHTYAQLAVGFEVGVSTVYRYITEAVGLLAARAPDFTTAVTAASAKEFVTLDGTLATDRPDRRRPAVLPRQAG